MTNSKIRALAPSELFELHEAVHAEMDYREEIEDKVKHINDLLKQVMNDLDGHAISFFSNHTGEVIDVVANENDCNPYFHIYWG